MPHEPLPGANAGAAPRAREASRRAALAKLGLAAGVAYLAPVVVHLDRASEAIAASHCPPGYTLYGGRCKKSYSDTRLKRDIEPVARLASGIGLYRYRYRWSETLYVGVIAQEVAALVPDAVTRGASGFLEVDYWRLGLALETWDEWRARAKRRAA
ncbi:MAG TPA: tail fiber domain-containing protein [Alphaproteobacteria bacterium]|nr:tail fiber domain-containing protein [Alphaproteobacteria bacterium]